MAQIYIEATETDPSVTARATGVAALGEGGSAQPCERSAARVVRGLEPVLTDPAAAGEGVLWRLTQAGRQLDANMPRPPAGASIATHTETDLDMLLMVLSEAGIPSTLPLTPGVMAWLPRCATRVPVAGEYGMVYLTAHQHRTGMHIHSRPDTAVHEQSDRPRGHASAHGRGPQR